MWRVIGILLVVWLVVTVIGAVVKGLFWLAGVGPRKMSEHYAYLAVHPRHVNLGCNYGAHLDDGGLLEGTGQNMRKTTVRTADDLADPRLVPLLQRARQERLRALGRT